MSGPDLTGGGPPDGTRLDHVGFVVPDLEAAVPLIRDGLGAQFLFGGDHDGHHFRTAQFLLGGGGKVELLQPLGDGPLRDFLERRGPGVHHVTFTVDDVAVTTRHLAALGLTPVDTDLSNPVWRETYLGPRQGLGTVLQFGDSVIDWSAAEPDIALPDVLAGRVEWVAARPRLRST